jgi:hypothetical protein
MNTVTRIFTLVVLGVVLTGCATSKVYDGPKRDPSDIAVIKPVARKVGFFLGIPEKERAQIVSVDREKVGGSFRGYPKHVDLLPGQHSMEAQYFTSKRKNISGATGGGIIPMLIEQSVNKGIINPSRTLVFDVERGETYLLKTSTPNGKGHDLKMWIENSETGEVVSNKPRDRSQSVLEKEARRIRDAKAVADET